MHFTGKLLKNECLRAGLVLIVVLNAAFFPVIWGNKSLMLGIGNTASIMPNGAYGDVRGLKGDAQGTRALPPGSPNPGSRS